MASPVSVVVMVKKPSPDAKVGIRLSSYGNGTVKVTTIDPNGLLADTALKPMMTIDTINGTKFSTSGEGVALLKAAEDQITITAFKTEENHASGDAGTIELFKKLVTEEFGKEYNIRWNNSSTKVSCTIEYKNNPDDMTACCCPGVVQQYQYTLFLQDGGRIDVNDDIAGTFNRMQGGMAAGNGNPTQIVGANNMMTKVVQQVGRIENRLMMHKQSMENPPAVATAIPAPTAESMERDGGVADEIAKLKTLLDDGVLTEEEFQAAKQKAISSM